ncbi:MAG: hypothetical protein FWG48_04175 [Oscillospiraceae bacterium]|nr:hypothetical protein [Oscillospiraceae bacterium]
MISSGMCLFYTTFRWIRFAAMWVKIGENMLNILTIHDFGDMLVSSISCAIQRKVPEIMHIPLECVINSKSGDTRMLWIL